LREITARVHSSADADTILRTAVREVSNALGRKAFIQLGNEEYSDQNDKNDQISQNHDSNNSQEELPEEIEEEEEEHSSLEG
jgi:hypothetical protein